MSPLGRTIPRRATTRVREALSDTRVVLVNGARQSGKSTLVADLSRDIGGTWYSLDRAATLEAARRDPTSFVRQANPMIIDEVQRVPELFLAMKELVDADTSPGRFLLTGSARILGLRNLPDALPGRMETIELWPLSQGEIDAQPEGLIEALFNGVEVRHDSEETREGYVSRIIRGGFPEAVARESNRRRRFHLSYVSDLVNRDVMQISSVERGQQMRALIDVLAARSGQIAPAQGIARDLRLAASTALNYISLLEEVFLIKRIPAWSRNLKTRATSSPKLAFVDSGIASSLLNENETSLMRLDSHIGPLLEGFVMMEIARQVSWADDETRLSHYRTRDQLEVDLILERQRKVIAVEIKASATMRNEDFRGLRHLQAKLGDDLIAGIVLYLGNQTLPFGENLQAIPVAALWEV